MFGFRAGGEYQQWEIHCGDLAINRPKTKKTLAAFLDFLLEKGVLDAAALETFRNIMKSRLMFGIIAIRESYITPDQLQSALELQTSDSAEVRIGELMLRERLMTGDQVERVLAIQRQSSDMPPDIILDTGILPREILEESLQRFLAT